MAPVLTRPLKRSQYSKYLYSLTLNFKNHNEIPTKINHYKFLSKFSQVFLSRFMLPFKSIMRFKHFWTCLSPIFSNKRIRQKRLLREELLVFWSIREQLLVLWKNIYPCPMKKSLSEFTHHDVVLHISSIAGRMWLLWQIFDCEQISINLVLVVEHSLWYNGCLLLSGSWFVLIWKYDKTRLNKLWQVCSKI